MTASARRRWLRPTLCVFALVFVALVGFAGFAGFFSRDPITVFVPKSPRKPVAALFFSGDTGLRSGMGPYVAAALARDGIRVTGFSSPAAFGLHRTRAEVDATVAAAVRRALATSGGDPLVVIGQSYGADILQTGLASLPADLRPRIAAVILVVPGETAYFRADPSTLSYLGTPDSWAPDTAGTLTWVPVTCIYGISETDSLCPHLKLPGVVFVPMPGGHYLQHDRDGLVAHILVAVRHAVPNAFPIAA